MVAFHTGARFEADRRGLTAELNQFPDPDSALLDAVTCVDMLTSPDGDPVTAEARLADIFSRYSPGTPVSDAVNASPLNSWPASTDAATGSGHGPPVIHLEPGGIAATNPARALMST